MRSLHHLLIGMLLLVTVSCNSAPATTPQVITVTKEIIVTYEVAGPTPEPVIIVAETTPTETLPPPAPTQSLSHDWVDYGGICMRPDNIPEGAQINTEAGNVESARNMLLEALWRAIERSENVGKLVPNFSSSASFIKGTSMEVRLRGPFIPIGKLPPRSDARSFNLEDPLILWGKIHPGEKFKGIALNSICLEFFLPLEFEKQKQIDSQIHYVSLVGGVSHAKFDLEDILGTTRLNIKLYKNPYGGTRDYKDLSGFAPSNTATENSLAANQHFGALIATLNTVLWGDFDGDGQVELGYGPKNSDTLPISAFQALNLFIPKP